MIKDAIQKKIRGSISILSSERGIIDARNNTIVANGNVLLAAMLLMDSTADITTIRVYDGATLLATGNITHRLIVGADNQTAQFGATFDNTSFSGHITKITLGCTDLSTRGIFAEVSGISITKLNTESITIYWNITFK